MNKIFIIHLVNVIVLSILSASIIGTGWVGAESETTINFEKEYYDPLEDTQIAAQEGHYITGNDWEDIDITSMELLSETKTGLLVSTTTIYMSFTVVGTINSDSEYIYGVYLSVGDTDYFLGYKEGGGIGVNMKTGNLVTPIVSGVGTSTITFTVEENQIGSPKSVFPLNSLAIKRTETSNYGDIAPNKLVKITEPWDRQTVKGTITIEGKCRKSLLDMDSVEFAVDGRAPSDWKPVIDNDGLDLWKCSLDTTTLTDGKHTIHARGTTTDLLEFEDKIEIEVHNSDSSLPSTNQEPEPHVGDSYNFEVSQSDESEVINIDISTTSTMEIKVTGGPNPHDSEDDIMVEGHSCWRMSTKQTGFFYIGNIQFDFDSMGDQYITGRGSDIVKEDTTATLTSQFTEEQSQHKVTIYEPPKTKYEFPLSVMDEWEVFTRANIDIDGEDSTQDLYIDKKCLFSGDTSVPAGNFETFAIRTQYQDATFYKVEYYSAETGYPVRIETYDMDDLLIGVLVLNHYSIKETFIEFENPAVISVKDNSGNSIDDENTMVFVGDPVTFNIDIVNSGTGTAAKAYVRGIVKIAGEEDEVQFDQETMNIGGGETNNAELTWTPNGTGTYTFIFETYSESSSKEIMDDKLEFTNNGAYIKVAKKEDNSDNGLENLEKNQTLIIVAMVLVGMVVLYFIFTGKSKKGKGGDLEVEEIEGVEEELVEVEVLEEIVEDEFKDEEDDLEEERELDEDGNNNDDGAIFREMD